MPNSGAIDAAGERNGFRSSLFQADRDADLSMYIYMALVHETSLVAFDIVLACGVVYNHMAGFLGGVSMRLDAV